MWSDSKNSASCPVEKARPWTHVLNAQGSIEVGEFLVQQNYCQLRKDCSVESASLELRKTKHENTRACVYIYVTILLLEITA